MKIEGGMKALTEVFVAKVESAGKPVALGAKYSFVRLPSIKYPLIPVAIGSKDCKGNGLEDYCQARYWQ